jgi:nitrogen fixation protein FixH
MQMQRVPTFLSAFTRIAAFVIAATAMSQIAVSPAAAQPPQKPKGAKSAGLDIMLMKPTAVKAGNDQFEVMVNGADGKPVADADVSVLFVMPAMPAMKMAEMRNEVKLKPAGPGTYAGSGNVMMAGKWNFTVSVKQGGKELGQKKLTLTAK